MDGVYWSTTGLQYWCHRIPSGFIILQFCILNCINLYNLWHTDALYINGHHDHNANNSSVFVTHVLFILWRWVRSAETGDFYVKIWPCLCQVYIWYWFDTIINNILTIISCLEILLLAFLCFLTSILM